MLRAWVYSNEDVPEFLAEIFNRLPCVSAFPLSSDTTWVSGVVAHPCRAAVIDHAWFATTVFWARTI